MLASTPLILRKSRMRKRARTDLRRGRSVMIVPTATAYVGAALILLALAANEQPGLIRAASETHS